MAVNSYCTRCGAVQRVATTVLGRQLKCGKCRQIFVAQADQPPAARPGPVPELPKPKRVAVNGGILMILVALVGLIALGSIAVGLAVSGSVNEQVKGKSPKDDPYASFIEAANSRKLPHTTLTPAAVEKPSRGKIADVAVGGRGRFLVMYVKDQEGQQLEVYDIKNRKWSWTIPLKSTDMKFTASLKKLIVARNDNGKLERYDLESGQLELTESFPFSGRVLNLAAGARANGFFLIRWANGANDDDTTPVDFMGIKEMHLRNWQDAPKQELKVRDKVLFRAGPTGRTYSAWCPNRSPASTFLYQSFTPTKMEISQLPLNSGLVMPGSEFHMLYTSTGQPMPGYPTRKGIPSVQGDFSLVPVAADEGLPSVQICLDNCLLPLMTCRLDAEVPESQESSDDYTNDKRLHFLPQDNVLIAIPATRDRINIYDVDLDKLLERAPNYLLVVSSPPSQAKAGEKVEYAIKVKSKKGGVKFELMNKLPGAEVSPDGVFTFTVPPKFVPPFGITIRDNSESIIQHRFMIEVIPGS